MIAYYWPPDNAAGVHRPLRFARYLKQFGWEPVILTASPIQYVRFDPNLSKRVPKDIQVLRASHRGLWRRFQKWRGESISRSAASEQAAEHSQNKRSLIKLKAYLLGIAREFVQWAEPRFYHPDHSMGWIRPAVSMAKKSLKRNEFQAIFATGGPWSTFEVGYQLAKYWRVPLILDFRDGWTVAYNEFYAKRPKWAQERDHKRLAKYLYEAQSVIFLHGTFAECYLNYYPKNLDENKIHLISNGFDPEDVTMHRIPPKGDHLSIIYVGTLSSRQYANLFKAVHKVIHSSNCSIKVRITFIGEEYREAINMVQKLGLNDFVRFFHSMPFEETNELMAKSHALLLLGEYPMPGYEMFVSSKIFHYLAMRRPILGILPKNEARKIIENIGAGITADIDSVENIETALLKLYDAWGADRLNQFLPEEENIMEYSAPKQTEALTCALSGTKAIRPYSRGEVSMPPSLRALLG